MKKYLYALFFVLCISVAHATGLYGTATVNVTSDTAASAKNMAMAEARRQIIKDVLGQYADSDILDMSVQGTDDETLTSMIATTSIDGEQTSDTTYSANISMTIDVDTARQWLVNNAILHWLPDAVDKNLFVVMVELKNPLVDWMNIGKMMRSEQIDFQTQFIQGATVVIKVPVAKRGSFTIAARENGWHFANMDTGLRIWK